MAELGRRIRIGGPHFEDLSRGQVFEDAPAVTLTDGHAAVCQAIFGDRLRLPLDAALCAAVTGSAAVLAHPMLVCNVVIGQSTGPSQRVRGNLFYRGLVLLRPVFIGDTLRTRTEVVGLKQNAIREGRPSTGLVALRIRSENQRGEPVRDFWRCPLLPLAPVFEEDVLRSDVEVVGLQPLDAGGGLVDLRVIVHAERGAGPEHGEEVQVLDWRLWGLMT